MSLRDEIQPYLDRYDLVAPYKCDPTKQGSDNGPMFTSEYYIMLAKSGGINHHDPIWYLRLIGFCMDQGLLCRAPADLDQEGPDDYYGVFAALVVLNEPTLGNALLNSIMSHKGFLNNHDGTRTWQSFLIRQPQLLAAAYAAADRAPVWSWPLYWYAAAVIATSCIGVSTEQADPRRLSWLLIQAVSPKSWLCRMAAKLWYRRLYKDYPDGMKGVARNYYQTYPMHPFIKYWVD